MAKDESPARRPGGFEASQARYEGWLRQYMPLDARALGEKRRLMSADPFKFLRATFFRWSELWHDVAGDEERHAAEVLAVGDLHLENFGTWRDADGRLIWGVNDFDEVTALPWTQDLVRLATSAYLAIDAGRLALGRRTAAAAIVEGYAEGLASGGCPFVLEERHGWLRALALGAERDPGRFWARLLSLPTVKLRDRDMRRLLAAALPVPGLPFRVALRTAGLGSRGRPRFVALAEWKGGHVAREAKALAPSAWGLGRSGTALQVPPKVESKLASKIRYAELTASAVRVPDPYLRVEKGWIVRRLGPHCSGIDLDELATRRDARRLLFAMGFETANIHLGAPPARVKQIARELRHRPTGWLHAAAKTFTRVVTDDWRAWVASGR
jgi:hypothetical protein